MPLRDHFNPPLIDRKSWDGLHGQWPAMIVLALSKSLPARYTAAPNVHLGSTIEIDVGTFDESPEEILENAEEFAEGTTATATWAPPESTLILATDLLELDEYEVLVFDTRPSRRLVAAVEIVSPSNKDGPEHRRAFVAKCASLLKEHVSVTIIDLVTTRRANLYAELLEFIGQLDPSPADGRDELYAATCRGSRRDEAGFVKTWAKPLRLGEPLPTLPLWLAEDRAVPLDLESSYEETCRVLRIS